MEVLWASWKENLETPDSLVIEAEGIAQIAVDFIVMVIRLKS